MTRRLLVVAGEASGDRAAAAVVDALRARGSLHVLGMGGPALESAGASLVADLRATTAMGVGAVARRAGWIALSSARVLQAVRREPVEAALLVNYSEFNARLAVRLHRQGVFVLWYGAPQVWAWRRGRASALRRHVDCMAVMLPFEEPLWRTHGVNAHYVGHPAIETVRMGRAEARSALGLTDLAKTVAILPGSRPHEVRSLLEAMLGAVGQLRRDRASIDARVLLAPSLDRDLRSWARARAKASQFDCFDVDASSGAAQVLAAFDVALVASGTAALEAALARAVPVVAYRVGFLTEAVARVLVRTEHVALPNILLGRRAFPELLQRDANSKALAREVKKALDGRAELVRSCEQVESSLATRTAPSEAVAALLSPWLNPAASHRTRRGEGALP